MTAEISKALELIAEKIQSPSNPKGMAAYVKSIVSWSKAASKVAASYNDRLGDAKPKDDATRTQQAALHKLLQSVSGELGQIADIAAKLK